MIYSQLWPISLARDFRSFSGSAARHRRQAQSDPHRRLMSGWEGEGPRRAKQPPQAHGVLLCELEAAVFGDRQERLYDIARERDKLRARVKIS